MGIAQTTMLFSGGALAHRRVSRVPAPRQLRQIAEDHTIGNLIAADALADDRMACGR